MAEVRGTTEVRVGLGERSYPIVIERGLIGTLAQPGRLGQLVRDLVRPTRVQIISNPTVDRLYGDAVRAGLAAAGLGAAGTSLIPDGEEAKNLQVAARVYDDLIQGGLDRKAAVIALGGGVVGDLAGFVAATYLRGVALVQVPTTLLAQVDSSVGGKVAVNHPLGKNLIGAFHQPKLVAIDPNTLQTLPRRERAAGLAEAVKHGLILDADYLDWIEAHAGDLWGDIDAAPPGVWEHLVAQSCRLKAYVVEQDEKEAGLRAILNFGHTIGHAIEAVAGYGTYLHGEAVAVGMIGAAWLSHQTDPSCPDLTDRVRNLVTRFELPTQVTGLTRSALLQGMDTDKKRLDGKQRWVLLERAGKAVLADQVPPALVDAALQRLGAHA